MHFASECAILGGKLDDAGNVGCHKHFPVFEHSRYAVPMQSELFIDLDISRHLFAAEHGLVSSEPFGVALLTHSVGVVVVFVEHRHQWLPLKLLQRQDE